MSLSGERRTSQRYGAMGLKLSSSEPHARVICGSPTLHSVAFSTIVTLT